MSTASACHERASPAWADDPRAPGYRRRDPTKTVLYNLVAEHLDTCLEQAQERSEHGFGYPTFIEREFRGFLGCGVLRRGFVRVRCEHCPEERLVAFSCKRRGVCPSCTARRMANTAAHLVDRVLPHVPYRQWVQSFPKRVRFLLARDADLLSRVLTLTLHKIFAWQRRKARSLGYDAPMCGAVTFCQRFGSLLNLNCHFHSLIPDGVFVHAGDEVRFVGLPPPSTADIARINGQIARATEKQIAKLDPDEDPADVLALDQVDTTREPRSAAPGADSPQRAYGRSAFLFGYSLHADRHINFDDREGLERLARYGARAPIANSRLSLDERGRAVVELKRRHFDGRTHITFEPVELLRRLATLIPPPWKNLTRYHGIFGPAHHARALIVPEPPAPAEAEAEPATTQRTDTHRIPWAALLRRVFAVEVLVCDRCGGPMRILSVITDPVVVDRILDHLHLEMPPSCATGPPPAQPAVH